MFPLRYSHFQTLFSPHSHICCTTFMNSHNPISKLTPLHFCLNQTLICLVCITNQNDNCIYQQKKTFQKLTVNGSCHGADLKKSVLWKCHDGQNCDVSCERRCQHLSGSPALFTRHALDYTNTMTDTIPQQQFQTGVSVKCYI